MKITIISPGRLPVPPIKGGAVETLIYEFIKENSINKKFKIDLFGCYDKEINKTKISQCKLYLFKQLKVLRRMFEIFNIKYNKAIKLINIIEEKLYISYINRNIQTSDYILIENKPHLIEHIKLKNECKKILHLHNSHISTYSTEIFDKYDKILCVSNYIKEEIIKIHKIDECKINVWHNCVSEYFIDSNIYDTQKLKLNLNIKTNDHVIAFVGRITPEKGIDKLIEAIKLTNIENIKLLIIGSSWFSSNKKTRYITELEKISEDIKEKIIFTGYIDHKIIPSYIELADIVILPSVWEEPFGLTIIESMSLGKMVISTTKGGIPEISKGEDIILLGEENLVNNISENIEYYLKSALERKKIGNNAKNTVLKFFTSKNYYKRFEDILGEL